MQPRVHAQGSGEEQVSRAEQARQLFFAGIEHSKNEEWSEAAAAFLKSAAIVERPSVLQNLVAALQRLGRYGEAVAAIERYLAIAQAPEFARTRSEFGALRARLEAQRGTLELQVEPAGAEVQLDGRVLPASEGAYRLRLDPGVYVIEAHAQGRGSETREIHLGKGESSTHAIRLPLLLRGSPPEDSPSAPPVAVQAPPPSVQAAPPGVQDVPPSQRRTLRPWLWTTASLTLVSAGLGTYTWLRAANEYHSLQQVCPDPDNCDESAHKQRVQRHSRATAALLSVAGASAVTSALLLWLDLRTPHTELSVGLGFSEAMLRGRF